MTDSSFSKGAHRATLTAATGTTGGAVLSLANPEGVDIIITRLILDITTPSTGAATIDAGIAANGTTSADNLIDGASVATAAKVLDNIADVGTNGKSRQKWGASQFLTITASATLAGMVGEAIIDYVIAD
jgi:hypothetical protein